MVIGAGFIGAEVASTCAGLGCRVTVLEALDIPLRNVIGPLLGAYCGSLHGANGVELRSGVAVQGVRRGPADAADVALGVAASGLVVDLAGGEALPADVVVVGIGVVPATGWLADSGLTRPERRRLRRPAVRRRRHRGRGGHRAVELAP